jgi:signal transduction histidine kinase
LLILAPVVALAVGGFVALSRNEIEVREEARQRTSLILKDLAIRASNGVERALDHVTRRTDSKSIDAERLKLQVFPNGRIIDPVPVLTAPAPPDWSVLLPESLRAARDTWKATVKIQRSESNSLVAAKAWQMAAKATPWETLAEFDLLSPQSADGDAWLSLAFRAMTNDPPTDAGLPVTAVALGRALQHPPLHGRTNLLSVLDHVVSIRPSLLTPWLNDMAAATVENDPDLLREVRTRQSTWTRDELRREFGTRYFAQGKDAGSEATPQWILVTNTYWLADFQFPASTRTDSKPTKPGVLSFVREDALAASVADAISPTGSAPPLPKGIALSVSLLGHALTAPEFPWLGTRKERRELPFAAEEIGLNSLPNRPAAPGSQDDEHRGPSGVNTDILSIRAYLDAPEELFAAQRRQKRLFEGLILSAAAVAGWGIWQTRNAFLREADLAEQRSNFIASVSHELRAPLASLRLLAEGLLEGRVQTESKRQQYARFLADETRRLSSLVENVLEFSRIDRGNPRYEFEPTDPVALLSDTARRFEPLFQQVGVTLTLHAEIGGKSVGWEDLLEAVPSPGLDVLWDARTVVQALTNLLDNARKHAPRDSIVTITLALPRLPLEMQDSIILRVSDYGPGIPIEDQTRIFERFYRRGSELRRETQGIGLGLTIVRQVAESHHGSIRVESHPGKGATFLLELPVDPSSRI